METASSLKFILIAVLILFAGCRNKKDTTAETSKVVPSHSGTSDSLAVVSIFDAALSGEISTVSLLLDKGLDVNSADKDGRSALMYAAYNGHVEIMKSLLEKGALVNLKDSNGRTALMMASSGPFPEAVRLLLEHQADPDLADNEEHFTALMYAASEGQIETVRILLSHRANPYLKDIDGDDARTFAGKNGHKEVSELLTSFMK